MLVCSVARCIPRMVKVDNAHNGREGGGVVAHGIVGYEQYRYVWHRLRKRSNFMLQPVATHEIRRLRQHDMYGDTKSHN